ncbi:MAG: glycoside hydrolase family 88 protein, partial [Clostridia bacterium]|nr:glycoside hydrolase family 88 protein [Clostridia bacterium]
DESTWSRGHSWGVLGFPIAYSYTKREDLIPLHRDVVYYMLNHLPEDLVPYWDYDFTEGDEARDSSAGAIAVCGLLDAAKYLPDSAPEKVIFKNAAHMIMDKIIDTCTNDIGEDYDGVMYKVTGAKKMNIAVEGCASYGDMFYFEALKRLQDPEWKHLW